MITWDADDNPQYRVIPTVFPVLHFSGYNSDGERFAYTSLDQLIVDPTPRRAKISWKDSQALSLDDLVPTGSLFVEAGGEQALISDPENEFVVFAAWSPTDPDLLAYTYNNAELKGLVIFNVHTMERVSVQEGMFSPDILIWSDTGKELVMYKAETLPDQAEVQLEGEEAQVVYQPQVFSLKQDSMMKGIEPIIKGGAMIPSFADETMKINFGEGSIVIPRITGGEENILESMGDDGQIVRTKFKAEQIRARNSTGIAFVNTDGRKMELHALGGKSKSKKGHVHSMVMKSAQSVSYYIPDPAGSTVQFTQIGESFSGGGCNVWDHTVAKGMGYAIDIQITAGNFDEILASAAGTVSSYVSTITCNSIDDGSIDGTLCNIYMSPCSSNSGWGNDVILSHSDGFYTKYTHLENGSHFQVHTNGASAAVGCWLADEGGTGASRGNKNTCGDHVHFQRQSSSGLNASSVTVSFVEDSSITSTDCFINKSPAHGGLSCSL